MEAFTKFATYSVVFFKLFHIVDAKFCAFELNGEPKYYACPRNEYCCNFGCCVTPSFQFYQLWYYWLLVIFMFLLCSGGGWWYRYWLQSRYRTGPGSTLPITAPSLQPTPGTQARRASRPRMARVSYNPTRDTVVLHRVWKGPNSAIHRNCPPPSYSSAQADVSSNTSPHYSGSSHPPMSHPNATSLFPQSSAAQECPYYQLYGPPPSYDSVMSELGDSFIPSLPTRQISSVSSPQDVCPPVGSAEVRHSPQATSPDNHCTEATNMLPNACSGPSTNASPQNMDCAQQGRGAREGEMHS
ncbi:uncharacterized protein [Periplaneta americana]|uniref:uncharacterized protein n=1 Tax=Periplaneta americana TaxID=6978 RepID=UPI0037E7B82E